MKLQRSLFAAILVSVTLLFGCASTTQIRTEPAGAEIIMDHTIKLGPSPIEYREMVWVWTDRRFEARMPGYKTQVFRIEKEYPWGQNLAACFCSAFILWPTVFASKYTPQTKVRLMPEGRANRSDGIDTNHTIAFDSSF